MKSHPDADPSIEVHSGQSLLTKEQDLAVHDWIVASANNLHCLPKYVYVLFLFIVLFMSVCASL